MKKFILLFIIIVSIAKQAQAQVYFAPAISYTTVGPNQLATTSGDYNNDGKVDLAVAGFNSSYGAGNGLVSILLGTGTGSFGAATNFAIADCPQSLISADFNGDGNLDIASADYCSNSTSILLGTGTGTFAAVTSLGSGLVGPYGITSADFNSDGFKDLALVGNNNIGIGNVSILLGTGTGSFGMPTKYGVGTEPWGVTSADFNGDGNMDLAVANQNSSNVSILLGTGTGSFGTATNYTVYGEPNSITTADFNGDGKLDLATHLEDMGAVSILIGDGTGSFGVATNYTVGSASEGSYSVISLDFNGDGKMDLATANYFSNDVSILLGTGTGSFGAATNFAVANYAAAVTSADFNGDGKPDLAIANDYSNKESVLLNCVPTVSFILVADSTPHTWDAYATFSSNVTNATWYWGDGTSSMGLYPSHTYSTPSRYNICVTGYTFCGDTLQYCQNDTVYRLSNNNTYSSMVQINVFSGVKLSASSSNICTGNSTTLTASGTNTYSWTPASGLSATTGSMVVASPTVTTTYTITGTTSNYINIDTITIVVNPTPTISIAPLATNTVICSGTSVVITPSLNLSGIGNYTIAPENQTGVSFTVSPSGNTTYTINGTNVTTGCTNTASNASIISFSVNPTPNVPALVSPSSSSITICQDSNLIISATPSGTLGFVTVWYNGTDHIATGINYTPSTTNAGTFVYSAIDSSLSGGCKSAATTLTITINSLPNLLVASGGPICSGDSASLIAYGANSYNWTSGGFTTSSITVSPSITTNYTVIGSSLGCISVATGQIWVNPLPTIIANTDTSIICIGDTATLTASGGVANNYSLTIAGGYTIWGFTSTIITPTVTTTYTVTGINGNGCKNMTTITQSVSTTCFADIEQYNNNNNEVNIYPNPNNGSFVIEPQNTLYNVHCTVYDVNGKVVLSQNINGKTSIDASSLNEGVYNISLQSPADGGIVNKRLVIVR